MIRRLVGRLLCRIGRHAPECAGADRGPLGCFDAYWLCARPGCWWSDSSSGHTIACQVHLALHRYDEERSL